MKKCSCCGKRLSQHTTDIAFELPDVVWELPKDQKKRRAKFDSDFCRLDDKRYFLRGIALIPFQSRDDAFAWGLWAEVSKDDFFHSASICGKDGTGEAPIAGKLANTPDGYEGLEGHAVTISFRSASERPTFHLLPSKHKMYREQRKGISDQRLHEILQLLE